MHNRSIAIAVLLLLQPYAVADHEPVTDTTKLTVAQVNDAEAEAWAQREEMRRQAEIMASPSPTNYHYIGEMLNETEWTGALGRMTWKCREKRCFGLRKGGMKRASVPHMTDSCIALASKLGQVQSFSVQLEELPPAYATDSMMAVCNARSGGVRSPVERGNENVPSARNWHYSAKTISPTSFSGKLGDVTWVCKDHGCYGLNRRGEDRQKTPSGVGFTGEWVQICGELATKLYGLKGFQPKGYAWSDREQAACNSGIKINGVRKYYYRGLYSGRFSLNEKARIFTDNKYAIRWTCEVGSCWASIEQRDPSWRHCKELRRQTGHRISKYYRETIEGDRVSLSRDGLNKCNN